MFETIKLWIKKSPGSFKDVIKKRVYKSYIIYMYKEDMALNKQQELICHKTELNQKTLIDRLNTITNFPHTYPWFGFFA